MPTHSESRAVREISNDAKAEFLELIRLGHNRPEAARMVGHTGTLFRALCKADTTFGAQYEEAYEEGREAHKERVVGEYQRRALDPEAKSDRLLYMERLHVDPDFHRAVTTSRQQIEHTGKDGRPIELTSTARHELVARLATLAELRDETAVPPQLETSTDGGTVQPG